MWKYRMNWNETQSLSHPPAEKRSVSMDILKEVEYLGVLRGSEVSELCSDDVQKEKYLMREEEGSEMVIMLSDVFMDDKTV